MQNRALCCLSPWWSPAFPPALCPQRLKTWRPLSLACSLLAVRSVWPAHPRTACQSPVCGGSMPVCGCPPMAGSTRMAMIWCSPERLRVTLASTPASRPIWLASGDRTSTSPWPVSGTGSGWEGASVLWAILLVQMVASLAQGLEGKRPLGKRRSQLQRDKPWSQVPLCSWCLQGPGTRVSCLVRAHFSLPL